MKSFSLKIQQRSRTDVLLKNHFGNSYLYCLFGCLFAFVLHGCGGLSHPKSLLVAEIAWALECGVRRQIAGCNCYCFLRWGNKSYLISLPAALNYNTSRMLSDLNAWLKQICINNCNNYC